jgi:hypothetical protein
MQGEETMKKVTLSDEAIWHTLIRLLHGRDSITPGYRRDFYGREIVATPYGGNYGTAGWVLCVNGSPPRGTVLLDAELIGVNGIVYWDGFRCRKVQMDSEAGRSLKRFYEQHLSQSEETVMFYPVRTEVPPSNFS